MATRYSNTNTEKRIRNLISNHYSIGNVCEVKQNFKGFVNSSYEIKTRKRGKIKRYFIKEYARDTQESKILFEHSIIKHLLRKNFNIVADIQSTIDGNTYVNQTEIKEDNFKEEKAFYAVFDFLTGEDRYRWDNPPRKRQQVQNAATVLAQYHGNIFDLNLNDRGHDSMIVNLLPKIALNIKKSANISKEPKFDDCLRRNLEVIQKSINSTLKEIDVPELKDIPYLAVHGDYHPANLKYQNDNISGLFDFDWATIDSRCFDVALSIPYFCGVWTDDANGAIDSKRMSIFLAAYQETLKNAIALGSLSKFEIDYFKYFIKAGNLYILNWIVADYYRKDVDKALYLKWLVHTVNMVEWLEIEKNLIELENIITVNRNR